MPLPNIGARALVPEVMDGPGLDRRRHFRALRGLERINALSLSPRILWGPIRDLLRAHPGRRMRLLDVACGAGDIARALQGKARAEGLPLEIEACDKSAAAIEFASGKAAASARGGAAIRFFTHDALAEPLPEGYDIVIASLFLHHLDESQAVDFLAQMNRSARCLGIVNDLERNWAGWALACSVPRVLSASPIVWGDARLSVEGAFTAREALALAARAGLKGVRITRHWPFRYRLAWNTE